jgi:hypothetical protein
MRLMRSIGMNRLQKRNAARICGCALTAAIGGCAAGNRAVPPGPAVVSSVGVPLKVKPLLFVGNSNIGVIDVFVSVGGSYQLQRQIQDPNGPEGLHTDAAGNLYVADQGIGSESPGVGDIAVYAPGAASPSRLIIPGYNISDVVPSTKGGLFAANFGPVGYFGPGSVSAYGGQKDVPRWTTVIPNAFQSLGIVRDTSNRDVFATYSTNDNKGHIARFAGGKPPAIDLGVTYGTPWGIAEDGKGNLLAAGGGVVSIFSRTGKARGTFKVPGSPYRLAFNTDRTLLFISNFDNFDVQIFTYPKAKMIGTVQSNEWSKYAWPDGVAFWPPPK